MGEDLPTSVFLTFTFVYSLSLSLSLTHTLIDLLMKWNLSPDLKVLRFKPSLRMTRGDPVSNVRKLLSSPEVCAAIGAPSALAAEDAKAVTVERLGCTVLNMNFFDVLKTDNEVVTDSDLVRGCMDETFDGITVQDKLREMLVNPDSYVCSIAEGFSFPSAPSLLPLCSALLLFLLPSLPPSFLGAFVWPAALLPIPPSLPSTQPTNYTALFF